MSGNDVLDVEAKGVKDEDQRSSVPVLYGERADVEVLKFVSLYNLEVTFVGNNVHNSQNSQFLLPRFKLDDCYLEESVCN